MDGRPGLGPVGLVLIAILLSVALNYNLGQLGVIQSEATKLSRLQQTNHLVMQTAMRLAAEASDPDADGFRETPAMRTGSGGPVGGGLLPLTSAAGKTDAWGRLLGYCAWDYGDSMGMSGYINPGRQSTNATEIAMLVVSPGPDGTFQTVCPTDPATVVPTAGGDDIVVGFTAAEVAQRASVTDRMLAFLNSLIGGRYRTDGGSNLDIAGTLSVGTGLAAGTPALTTPDGTVTSVGRRLSQAVYSITSARPGDVVPQPACPSGLSPEIHLGVFHLAADGSGTPWSAFQAYAVPSGGAWQIGLDVRTQSGWSTPSPPDVARLLVITKCG